MRRTATKTERKERRKVKKNILLTMKNRMLKRNMMKSSKKIINSKIIATNSLKKWKISNNNEIRMKISQLKMQVKFNLNTLVK